MKNYIQDGEVLDLTAPSGDVVSGNAYKIGALVVVALISAAEGETFTAKRHGVFELPVTTANTPAVGDKAYWNDTAKEVTTTASGNTLIGVFVSAKSSDDLAEVLLTGQVV